MPEQSLPDTPAPLELSELSNPSPGSSDGDHSSSISMNEPTSPAPSMPTTSPSTPLSQDSRLPGPSSVDAYDQSSPGNATRLSDTAQATNIRAPVEGHPVPPEHHEANSKHNNRKQCFLFGQRIVFPGWPDLLKTLSGFAVGVVMMVLTGHGTRTADVALLYNRWTAKKDWRAYCEQEKVGLNQSCTCY